MSDARLGVGLLTGTTLAKGFGGPSEIQSFKSKKKKIHDTERVFELISHSVSSIKMLLHQTLAFLSKLRSIRAIRILPLTSSSSNAKYPRVERFVPK